MPIEAVIFDIGGVLEVTPPTGWLERWASRLGLSPIVGAGKPALPSGVCRQLELLGVRRFAGGVVHLHYRFAE